MAEVNFPDVLNQLKDSLFNLAQTDLKEFASDAKGDIQMLLKHWKMI